MFLELVKIDFLDSSDQYPQFLWFESFNDSSGDDSGETPLEGSELLGDAFVQNVIGIEETVVVLVVVGEFYGRSVLNQLLDILFAEAVQLDHEVKLELFYIVRTSQDILQGTVDVRLYFLEILDHFHRWLVFKVLDQELFKNDLWEVNI